MLKLLVPLKRLVQSLSEEDQATPEFRIELAVRNMKPEETHQFVFLCHREFIEQYALRRTLRRLSPDCSILGLNRDTDGDACAMLLAIEHLASEDEVVVTHGDWHACALMNGFLRHARTSRVDCCIVDAAAGARPSGKDVATPVYYFRRAVDLWTAAERVMLESASGGAEYSMAAICHRLHLAGKHVARYDHEC